MDQQIKINDKPTFKERIFGIPSSDEISKIKYKINFINIIVVVGIIVLAATYYTQNAFRNRAITITTTYENSIKLPEIKIEAHSIYMGANQIYLNYAEITDENNKDLYLSMLQNLSNIANPYVIYENLTSDYVNLTLTSITLYPNDYFSLGFNEDLRVLIGFFRMKVIPQYYPFNISITVNNEENFLLSSRESFNMGISKTIKIDQYKNQVETYKTRLSTILYGIVDEVDYIGESLENQISFFTQIVTTETTQTDYDIYLEILSSVGSLISTVALVAGIGFSIITKFFIKDKGGWVDNEIREAIVYHSNLLNNENLQSLSNNNSDPRDEVHFIN